MKSNLTIDNVSEVIKKSVIGGRIVGLTDYEGRKALVIFRAGDEYIKKKLFRIGGKISGVDKVERRGKKVFVNGKKFDDVDYDALIVGKNTNVCYTITEVNAEGNKFRDFFVCSSGIKGIKRVFRKHEGGNIEFLNPKEYIED